MNAILETDREQPAALETKETGQIESRFDIANLLVDGRVTVERASRINLEELSLVELTTLERAIKQTLVSLSQDAHQATQPSGVFARFFQIKSANNPTLVEADSEKKALDGVLKSIQEQRDKVENKKLKGMARNILDAIMRDESCIICGITDDDFLEFLQSHDFLNKNYEVMTADQLRSVNIVSLGNRRIIVTEITDLQDPELLSNMFGLRGWVEQSGRSKASYIVIAPNHKPGDSKKIFSSWILGSGQNPYFNGPSILEPQV